jgi:NAD(P)-dependent dehydrogenase (short-subunit alcohol dehydrogenase family)
VPVSIGPIGTVDSPDDRVGRRAEQREGTNMEIRGVKAIIIGGASGFARATAERIAAGGGSVAILDRAQSAGAEVADALGGTWHPTDVLDFDGIAVVIDEAVEALGGLHVAVNTAGGGKAGRTLGRSGPFDLDDFRAVIDLNLIGTFNTNRLCAAHMANGEPNDDGERGVLINTASIAAFEGQIGQVAYTAAKAGIAGMTLTMARDLGSLGIRVNTIAPSLFATGLTAGVTDDRAANLTKDAAFPKRLGRPDEYARLAVAIIENPMLNGDTIRLDAGTRFAPK